MKRMFFIVLAAILITSLSFKVPGDDKAITINFNANPADWKPEGKSGTPGCYMEYRFKSDTLTERTFNNGMVMVYVLGTSGGGWYPLPHTYYTSGKKTTTTFNYQVGYIELRTYTDDNKLSPFMITMRYKLVVVPG